MPNNSEEELYKKISREFEKLELNQKTDVEASKREDSVPQGGYKRTFSETLPEQLDPKQVMQTNMANIYSQENMGYDSTRRRLENRGYDNHQANNLQMQGANSWHMNSSQPTQDMGRGNMYGNQSMRGNMPVNQRMQGVNSWYMNSSQPMQANMLYSNQMQGDKVNSYSQENMGYDSKRRRLENMGYDNRQANNLQMQGANSWHMNSSQPTQDMGRGNMYGNQSMRGNMPVNPQMRGINSWNSSQPMQANMLYSNQMQGDKVNSYSQENMGYDSTRRRLENRGYDNRQANNLQMQDANSWYMNSSQPTQDMGRGNMYGNQSMRGNMPVNQRMQGVNSWYMNSSQPMQANMLYSNQMQGDKVNSYSQENMGYDSKRRRLENRGYDNRQANNLQMQGVNSRYMMLDYKQVKELLDSINDTDRKKAVLRSLTAWQVKGLLDSIGDANIEKTVLDSIADANRKKEVLRSLTVLQLKALFNSTYDVDKKAFWIRKLSDFQLKELLDSIEGVFELYEKATVLRYASTKQLENYWKEDELDQKSLDLLEEVVRGNWNWSISLFLRKKSNNFIKEVLNHIENAEAKASVLKWLKADQLREYWQKEEFDKESFLKALQIVFKEMGLREDWQSGIIGFLRTMDGEHVKKLVNSIDDEKRKADVLIWLKEEQVTELIDSIEDEAEKAAVQRAVKSCRTDEQLKAYWKKLYFGHVYAENDEEEEVLKYATVKQLLYYCREDVWCGETLDRILTEYEITKEMKQCFRELDGKDIIKIAKDVGDTEDCLGRFVKLLTSHGVKAAVDLEQDLYWKGRYLAFATDKQFNDYWDEKGIEGNIELLREAYEQYLIEYDDELLDSRAELLCTLTAEQVRELIEPMDEHHRSALLDYLRRALMPMFLLRSFLL